MTEFILPLIVFDAASLTCSTPMNKYNVVFIQVSENGVL
jgi:hypothetical protein